MDELKIKQKVQRKFALFVWLVFSFFPFLKNDDSQIHSNY